MSDFENELLDLAEDDPSRKHKKAKSCKRRRVSRNSITVIDDSDDEEQDMDMDLESEEGDGAVPSTSKPIVRTAKPGSRNPYPLEGKYIDEDDREQLEGLPEIERENILASRLEEIQKLKDAQQLDAIFKMTAGGEEAGDDDDLPRKRRKHTSVSKEASRAIKDLKNKRKATSARAAKRAAERGLHGSNSEPATDSEEGQISFRDTWRSPSPRRSPEKKKPIKAPKAADLDGVPPDHRELNSARLSRYEIVDMLYKDGFDELLKGSYVRIPAPDPDPTGRQKYRVHKVINLETNPGFGSYKIEYKGREIKEDRGLLCQYGRVQRVFRIADVSNGDIDDGEFSRFMSTNHADRVAPPKRSELLKKHEDIKAMHRRPMTNDEISRQVAARRAANPSSQRSTLQIEISNLISSRNLALRRNDLPTVERLNAQIISMGGDPETGTLVDATDDLGEYDAKIQKINEHNRKRAKEATLKQQEAERARRRAEEATKAR
ncbi:hypothetical protein TREMEDRAFT_69995 [Tremella mesenterica DSM 1558]|uniref:uncharacterized protein n=1 Tax=Tremella mesenterica (strain ATCC 24925 / CBS 8224 / DSM 1558 / NBRC 9311 / NRRL Y-6157 / RJB 2259-6 / UBC 559-6) TaxID=578456 RepID=UPI0003F4A02C|nr:uncharacterized protein TREMEDRAFT_69995 [Tremella mesenterica DSM 1558]EIW67131.1 hypothetical protein TREMEDRAFT_69995 [Tremella mesenterica DSM 1558]